VKIPAGSEEYADFRSKTVHERAKLLAASGKQDRLDMTAATSWPSRTLPCSFPRAWVAPTNQASRFAQDGFDIGDGWFDIVDRLSAKLSADPNLHVWQLKEKMGRLTVYFCDSAASSDPRLDEATDAALDEAAEESMRTCEVCGQPGIRDKRRHWVSVRCEPCLQIDDTKRKP